MGVWIVVSIVVALVGAAEFYVWYSEILWHKEDEKARGDRRNWGP
jgi:hypothetical protein